MKEQAKKILSLLLQASKTVWEKAKNTSLLLWSKIKPAPKIESAELKTSIWLTLRLQLGKSIAAFIGVVDRSFAKLKIGSIKTGHGLKFSIKILLKILHGIWIAVKWLYHHIADLFRKIPSELTYWHDDVLITVHVDDFVELAPNLIQYRDNDTKKRVKVKAEFPIKYILKEK
jgi:hypothetical protein